MPDSKPRSPFVADARRADHLSGYGYGRFVAMPPQPEPLRSSQSGSDATPADKPGRKVVVFWTTEDRRHWIGSELLAGRLRQGWGIPGTELTENGVLLSFSTWSKRFGQGAERVWNSKLDDEWMKTRHGILSRMVNFRKGDLLIVPKVPSEHEFAIAQVTNGYRFDDKHFNTYVPGAPQIEDFGHVMQVDPNTLVTRPTNSSPEAKAIAAKFRHYRSAVNNVQDADYANLISTFYDRATGNGA